MTGTRELLGAALSAAARGWQVFPLAPGRKTPAVRDWETRATADAERIRRCWSAGPFNVGVACGPSGLVVVDLDTPKPGQDTAGEWRLPGVGCGEDVLAVVADRAGQPLPVDTLAVRTGRGGLHLYFAAPTGSRLRNTAGRLGWLIDTRAAGGYVVAAGSIVDGRPYRLLTDRPPAPLPGWLADRLTDPGPTPGPIDLPPPPAKDRAARYAHAALRGELQHVLDAPAGTRNHTLNRAAFALGQLVAGRLLDEQLVVDALGRAGQAIGLSGRECAATIASGLRAGARTPRDAA
jgi:Bifunctional DNA primase/polymerase, N-terminal